MMILTDFHLHYMSFTCGQAALVMSQSGEIEHQAIYYLQNLSNYFTNCMGINCLFNLFILLVRVERESQIRVFMGHSRGRIAY